MEVFVSHVQTYIKIAINLVSEVLVTYKAVIVKHVALGICCFLKFCYVVICFKKF